MSHCRPYPQRLCTFPPWVCQMRPQLFLTLWRPLWVHSMRAVAGLLFPLLVPLFWPVSSIMSKNREVGWALALGSHRQTTTHNNQPKVGINGGKLCARRQPGDGACGGVPPHHLGSCTEQP